MGGYTSGRYRTRNRGTVDAACRVDLRFLRKRGALGEGRVSTGVLTWTCRGRTTGSLGYTARMVGEDRRLILSFTYGGETREVTVSLEAVPMRFGGFRYYALCPVQGRRCEVLAVVAGKVACRQAHRLTYATQSMDRLGRLRERVDRAEKQLFAKRRRGATRRRMVEAWGDATADFEALANSECLRRFGALF